MMLYVCWLNKAKTGIFQPTVNFENFEIYLYVFRLPASLSYVRPGCTRCKVPEIHMIKVIVADLRKCCSEDDLPTGPRRFLLSFFPPPCCSLFL